MIDHIGMWTWGGRVCLANEAESLRWREIVTGLVRDYYAPLKPDGICFQVGGTEFGTYCKSDCDVCREAYKTGVGPLYVEFAGRIMDAVRAQWPALKMYANLHLGQVHASYEALQVLDPAINIMWEDLPGPEYHIHVPFAYEWELEDTTLQDSTVDMVRRMCELRGEREDVSFVIKGFPAHWGGLDPTLLEDFDLKVLSSTYQHKWDAAADYCERKLDQALRVFRVISESPAREKTVVMLVEHGLWEYRRHYAAELIAEALRNPFRDPSEVIRVTRELQRGNIE